MGEYAVEALPPVDLGHLFVVVAWSVYARKWFVHGTYAQESSARGQRTRLLVEGVPARIGTVVAWEQR